MTVKEAYERIRNHFSQPGVQFGYDPENDQCLYRAPNGAVCAVGCLIPKDKYQPRFDAWNKGASGFPAEAVVKALPDVFGTVDKNEELVRFLRDAQQCHDDRALVTSFDDSDEVERQNFVGDLDRLARQYGIIDGPDDDEDDWL